jgi:hypothetical protein
MGASQSVERLYFDQPSLFSRSWNALDTCFAFLTLNVPFVVVFAGQRSPSVRNNPIYISSLLGIVLLSRCLAAILDATSGTSVMRCRNPAAKEIG